MYLRRKKKNREDKKINEWKLKDEEIRRQFGVELFEKSVGGEAKEIDKSGL